MREVSRTAHTKGSWKKEKPDLQTWYCPAFLSHIPGSRRSWESVKVCVHGLSIITCHRGGGGGGGPLYLVVSIKHQKSSEVRVEPAAPPWREHTWRQSDTQPPPLWTVRILTVSYGLAAGLSFWGAHLPMHTNNTLSHNKGCQLTRLNWPSNIVFFFMLVSTSVNVAHFCFCLFNN